MPVMIICSYLQSRRAIKFLDDQTAGQDPFFMMLSTPSAHHPFTPAPQYATNFSTRLAPRTLNYNIHAAVRTHILIYTFIL